MSSSTWVIAGGSRGIGYEFVRQLALEQSNNVVALVRDVKSTQEKLVSDGVQNVHVIEYDMSSHESIYKAAEAVAPLAPSGVDYLINNGAYFTIEAHELTLADAHYSPEKLEKEMLQSFQVNAIGLTHTIRAFLPLLRKGSVKKCIYISTAEADNDTVNGWNLPVQVPYAISKAAGNMAISKFNATFNKEHILFCSIAPGMVDTGNLPAWVHDQMDNLKALAGPYFKGPATTEEAVKQVRHVIDEVNLERGNGGAFLSQFGNKKWL